MKPLSEMGLYELLQEILIRWDELGHHKDDDFGSVSEAMEELKKHVIHTGNVPDEKV